MGNVATQVHFHKVNATINCGKLKSLVIQSFPVVTVKVTMQVLGVYELKL